MSSCMYARRNHIIIIIFITFCFSFSNVSADKKQHGNQSERSPDFSKEYVEFLKSLDKFVFKNKSTNKNVLLDILHKPVPTVKNKKQTAADILRQKQKSALGDVLMLKLVSYYENKFQLHPVLRTTTELAILSTDSNLFQDDEYAQSGKFGEIVVLK